MQAVRHHPAGHHDCKRHRDDPSSRASDPHAVQLLAHERGRIGRVGHPWGNSRERIRRWRRLMEQALTGLNGQVRPSPHAEAPGLLAYSEPAFTLIACSAGWRDTTLRHAFPM